MMVAIVKTSLGSKFALYVPAIFILGLFNGCTWDHIDDIPCNPQVVTFSGDLVPILQRACTPQGYGGCHEAGSLNKDYTTYAGVKAAVDNGKLQDRVINKEDMPPDYSSGPIRISACEIQKIQKWIDEGAPNN